MRVRRIVWSGLALAALVGGAVLLSVTDRSATAQELSFEHVRVDGPGGQEQTASLILDIDRDGLNDFVIAQRSSGLSVVWYKKGNGPTWTPHVIDAERLRIEAGGTAHDVDGDGDLDIAFGGDVRSNQIWWWENPHPDHDPDTPWLRHLIKDSGATKHHDNLFADVDHDGQAEFITWNQRARALLLAEIPEDPSSGPWTFSTIFETPNRNYEGLAAGDVDGDGDLDLVAAGHWFEHQSDGSFTAHVIDADQTFTRAAVGQLIPGGWAEVVFVPGDADGPLRWYAWDGTRWQGHDPLGTTVYHGHSLQLGDVNGDGHLDLFVAEMALGTDQPAMRVLLGDGSGGFRVEVLREGVDNHESKLGDLDGDGDLDILGKPYDQGTPRVDVWLNTTPASSPLGDWQRHVLDDAKPWRSLFVDTADLDTDGATDVITGGWWYRHPGTLDGAWERRPLGAPLHNMAAVQDFDGDGDVDVLGTQGKGASRNATFAWARNDGGGAFTVLDNIEPGNGDFLQGVAIERLTPGEPLTVALSWHEAGVGVQTLTVPPDPSTETWTWQRIASISQDEALSAGDLDRDGDLDLLLGTRWLRNEGGTWSDHALHDPPGTPDRNRLADVNGDGRLDAVVGYEAISRPGVLAWYEQPMSATSLWTEHVIATIIGPMSVDVADLDGDGDVDVVAGEHSTADPEAARLYVFENADGAGRSWTQHLVHTGDEHHDGAHLADLDGDGDLDIVSIGWTHGRVVVYENTGPTDRDTSRAAPPSPVGIDLGANYPNPFRDTTAIRFHLPEPMAVTLAVYNLLGQTVATLVDGPQPGGWHTATWTPAATSLPASGLYWYRLQAGPVALTQPMVLLR
ncbi:MAG: T9SS type A sorting domain-containing protein [Bacteroidetes bacterium]|jgi:hypothetical protein|nr:T9SS type A sorting domain-containing protein [Bacteroidota bacterium]